MGKYKDLLKGTGKVFRFSLSQQLKSRVNLITFLIMLVLAAAAVPFLALQAGGGAVSPSKIKTVFILNDTGYVLDPELAGALNPAFSGTVFEMAQFPTEEYETNLPEDGALAVITGQEDGSYHMDLYTLETSGLDEEDTQPLEQLLLQLFQKARIAAAGASEEQLLLLGAGVETDLVTEEEYRNPRETNWETQFALQYAYAIIVMMLCLITSSYVVRAIAEEKSSKLVELLMVSVRPLALLAGKILAMMVYILILIGVMLAGAGASWLITGHFIDLSGLDLGAAFGVNLGELHLGVGLIAIMVICILLGYLTFSMVAGLAGSCCASMDDVEWANMKVVLLVLAGYLVSCISSAFISGWVCTAVSLIPLVSVFCAPVQYAMGNISLGILALSWILQAAVIAGLAIFSGKVYNDLIIFRGSRVGLRQLAAMAGKKGGANR